jgi:hypothetical protein
MSNTENRWEKDLYFQPLKFSGGEGGLKPQPFKNPRFTRVIAAIAFTTASFQTSMMKRREVPRSAKKPKKWRKTVARSSPRVEITS